jgi:hypothetical protein
MMSSHNDSFAASGTSPTEIDFICDNHGSIFLLRPASPAANSWVSQHLPEDHMTFGDGIVVEHRYMWPILEAIQSDGLVVSRG